MPLNWDNVTSITKTQFIPILQDAVYKSNPLFIRLLQEGRIVQDMSYKLLVPIIYDIEAGGSYSKYQVLDSSPREVITAMETSMKAYYSSATIAEEDILANAGSSRVLDMLAARIKNMENSLKHRLGTALFAASPAATDLDSLDVAIATSGTYGGIDRSTYTWFRGNVTDLNNGEPTFLAFQDMYGQCTQGDTAPDLIVTTQKVYNKLWAMALPAQKLDTGDETTLGWPYLRFNKAKIMVDSHVPAGKAYFLNTEFIKLIVHKLQNFEFIGWYPAPQQDARTGRVQWRGNVVVQNPRFCGKIVNISES